VVTQGEGCERKRKLLQDLLQVLSRVSDISGTQSEIARQSASDEPSGIDDMLQHAFSEQRKALRALEDHQEKHGC
jgi:hypothetical protein